MDFPKNIDAISKAFFVLYLRDVQSKFLQKDVHLSL